MKHNGRGPTWVGKRSQVFADKRKSSVDDEDYHMYRTAPPKEKMFIRITLTKEEVEYAIREYLETSTPHDPNNVNIENFDLKLNVNVEAPITVTWEEKVL